MSPFPTLDFTEVTTAQTTYVPQAYDVDDSSNAVQSASELEWPFNDPKAMASLERGIQQAKAGKIYFPSQHIRG